MKKQHFELQNIDFDKMRKTYNEKQFRHYLASLAKGIGRGGITAVSLAANASPSTIRRGIAELDGTRPCDKDRVRLPGGGRKPITQLQPGIKEKTREIVEPEVYGDPCSEHKYVRASASAIAAKLQEAGFSIKRSAAYDLVRKLGYTMQQNKKADQVGEPSPFRDEQICHINEVIANAKKEGSPVISVDTKKKEKLGNFANKGKEYRPKKRPRRVLDHDFPIAEKGKAVPYGVYDVASNTGLVNVGTTADTSQFAVESIRRWWKSSGRSMYPDAKELVIICDGGGSNGYRRWLYKLELIVLSAEIGLPIKVCHYPPGASKWNKIEHRMFSYISINWAAQPLKDMKTLLGFIKGTTTKAGLKIDAMVDDHMYKSGGSATKADKDFVKKHIKRDTTHGEWNYTLFGVPEMEKSA